jgi:hypothetical protein
VIQGGAEFYRNSIRNSYAPTNYSFMIFRCAYVP